LGITAQNTDKKVTIRNKNISIKDALSRIEQQTGYSAAYEQSTLDLTKKISLSLKNADINHALEQILKGTVHVYKIRGYHIIISPLKKEESLFQNGNLNRLTQTIRGIVVDAKTNRAIEFASVIILNKSSLGSVTDSLGFFKINNVPVGRYTIQVSFVGYTENMVRDVVVTSSKEVFLEIKLNENSHSLQEIIVSPVINKSETLNPMALTGGSMISMEEAGRFANGFDDPARLVSAFAGVAGNIGSNAIAVRGNSPQFTQWRLEGVEIPNPTHFADLAGLGGGFLSALSTQVIGNSDFYNGAFPAEYNNALSGVFDIYMRNGNNQNYEHTFQAGLLGVDLASEGPINKKSRSSYIFNYRFSFTSLASGGTSNLKYQDLSFKLNFPTKKAGVFSVWGLGLIDKNKVKAEDQSEWETQVDRQSGKNKLNKFSGGITHKYFIDKNTYIRSSLSSSYAEDRTLLDQQTWENDLVHLADIRNKRSEIMLNSYLNKRFSSKHYNRSGITITGLKYDLNYKVSPDFGLDKPMEQVSKGDGTSTVISAYTNSVININQYLTVSLGITAQYFNLNKNWSVEPRMALKWQMKNQHSLAIAYGLHSKREKLDYYFIEKILDGKRISNRYLDFSKAHHLGLSYDWNINSNLRLKIEPYYQYLFHIPVEENTSFSVINHNGFYLERILKNKGLGKNYGIDITLERYMKDGVYYMLTGSFFKSKYKGGDKIWRNTKFDRGYIFNALAGKEWMVGKQNVLNINARVFFHGGDRYTPIDEKKTNETHDIEFDETKAFSKKFNPSINGDISVSYRINKKKVAHEFSLKILNIGAYTGMHFYRYNENINKIEKKDGIGSIANISYKIYF